MDTTRLSQAFEDALVEHVRESFIAPVSFNNRWEVPNFLLMDVVAAVDMGEVKKLIKKDVEELVAKKIMHSMMTQVANDVKQAMSRQEVRETMQEFMRNHIDELLHVVGGEDDN